ncbi:hypothetical protein FOXYSP1_03236 [Fusarium oxysporum f. sp. phaseoli]
MQRRTRKCGATTNRLHPHTTYSTSNKKNKKKKKKKKRLHRRQKRLTGNATSREVHTYRAGRLPYVVQHQMCPSLSARFGLIYFKNRLPKNSRLITCTCIERHESEEVILHGWITYHRHMKRMDLDENEITQHRSNTSLQTRLHAASITYQPASAAVLGTLHRDT